MTHALEDIASAMSSFDEERMHAGMLLAFATASYSILSQECIMTPIHRVGYDESNNHVYVTELNGLARPPQKGMMDISVMDMILCSDLREMSILLEGETGTGKTHPATKYMATIFDSTGMFSYRLSANAFLNNLFTHFQEGQLSNGMPVISAKMDAIDNCGAGLIDEINRGDPNETLQLLDNQMHLGGKIYRLGVQIPVLNGKTVDPGSRKKKLLVIAAQNPSSTEDAKFTSTMTLDAAVDNRLLKTFVANASPSTLSGLWYQAGTSKPHQLFLDEFAKRVSGYLKTKTPCFGNLAKDWLATYAWITDSNRTDKPVLYSAAELADMMMGVLSGNLIEYFNYQKSVISEWNASLAKGVELNYNMTETEQVKRIHEVVATFKVPIIFRDVLQIKKLADVLSTLSNLKSAAASPDPVKTYLDTKRYVTVREVSESVAMLARSKQPYSAISPVNAVNAVLSQYVTLLRDYRGKIDTKSGSNYAFDIFDPNAGIKRIAIYKAIRNTQKDSMTVDSLIDEIAGQAKVLSAMTSASEDIRSVIISVVVGDLMTLCGFINDYKTDVQQILTDCGTGLQAPPKVMDRLGQLYKSQLRSSAIYQPPIYQHRIPRTLGVSDGAP